MSDVLSSLEHHPDRSVVTARPRLTTERLTAGIVVILASAWSVLGARWLFPLLTDNADEGAYLAQAAGFRAGYIFPPAPRLHPEAFQPWFAVLRNGNYVYRYPPVHPALIALSHLLFGSDRALLVLVAAANLVLLALLTRELGAPRRAVGFACIVFALSPLWLVMSTTFLPYASNLALLQGFAVLLLRGWRRQSRRLVALAGLCAGTAFFARPFEAVVFAGTVIAWQLWRTRGTGATRRIGPWFALGGVPPLVLFLCYNAAATGSPFRLAFHLTGSDDQVGFGSRRVLSTDAPIHYTPWKAVEALANNMNLTITWAFGSFAVIGFVAVGYLWLRRRRGGALLPMLLMVWPVAFFFFWGSYSSTLLWGITGNLGPFYYLPMLVPLSIGAGTGIARVSEWRSWLGATVVVLLAGLTVFTLAPAVSANRARTASRQAVMARLVPLAKQHRSLVFLPPAYGPFLQNPFSFLRNEPSIGGRTVYALDGTNRDFDVISGFKGRTPFVLSTPEGFVDNGPTGHVPYVLDRLRTTNGDAIEVEVRTFHILQAQRPQLRISLGSFEAEVPFDDDGAGGGIVRFVISRVGADVGVATNADTGSATIVRPDPGDALVLTISALDLLPGSPVAGRLVPLQRSAKGISMLTPGILSIDRQNMGTEMTVHASALARAR